MTPDPSRNDLLWYPYRRTIKSGALGSPNRDPRAAVSSAAAPPRTNQGQ